MSNSRLLLDKSTRMGEALRIGKVRELQWWLSSKLAKGFRSGAGLRCP